MFSTTDPWLPFWKDENYNHWARWLSECTDEEFQHLRRKYAIWCIISHTSYIAKQLTK